jgi:MtN3 and saliva related transmembrane protein
MNAEWLGTIAATLTTISFVPQALKAIRSRETRGISLLMYSAFTLGIGFWFAYGVALHSWPMIVSNAITFVLAATILVLKLRFG